MNISTCLPLHRTFQFPCVVWFTLLWWFFPFTLLVIVWFFSLHSADFTLYPFTHLVWWIEGRPQNEKEDLGRPPLGTHRLLSPCVSFFSSVCPGHLCKTWSCWSASVERKVLTGNFLALMKYIWRILFMFTNLINGHLLCFHFLLLQKVCCYDYFTVWEPFLILTSLDCVSHSGVSGWKGVTVPFLAWFQNSKTSSRYQEYIA